MYHTSILNHVIKDNNFDFTIYVIVIKWESLSDSLNVKYWLCTMIIRRSILTLSKRNLKTVEFHNRFFSIQSPEGHLYDSIKAVNVLSACRRAMYHTISIIDLSLHKW